MRPSGGRVRSLSASIRSSASSQLEAIHGSLGAGAAAKLENGNVLQDNQTTFYDTEADLTQQTSVNVGLGLCRVRVCRIVR